MRVSVNLHIVLRGVCFVDHDCCLKIREILFDCGENVHGCRQHCSSVGIKLQCLNFCCCVPHVSSCVFPIHGVCNSLDAQCGATVATIACHQKIWTHASMLD